jgi:TorA maturation chaperone TorD
MPGTDKATDTNSQTLQPDYQLIRIRSALLELLKSFFAVEPDPELLASWRGAAAALKEQETGPGLKATAEELSAILSGASLKEIQDEHYRLFVDPFSPDHVHTNVCWYIDGRNFGPSFAAYKKILQEAGIEKGPEAQGSEDEIAIVLDAYQQLIEAERGKGGDLEQARNLQSMLLSEILIPFTERFRKHMAENGTARLYRACADLLYHCLNLERALFL